MTFAEKTQRPDELGEPDVQLASGVEVAGSRFDSSPGGREATHGSLEQTYALTPGPLPAEPADSMPESVARACAGDRAALEQLARQELPRVERLLRRMLGHRSDLEDLVQTVFLEMCRALPGFRGDSAISTFIGGITVRVARRAMRPSAWARFRSPMPDEAPAGPDRPEARAVASEQLRRLDRALLRLSADKRIAFVLWAIEGNDVALVAELTGASVSATRSRIYYAQKELKVMAAADPYLRELVEGPHAG